MFSLFSYVVAPLWDTIGDLYSNHSNLVIAKIDASENEVYLPGVLIKGLPSIYLFKGFDKTNPVKYLGDKSLEGLVSFLDDNLSKSDNHEESVTVLSREEL